MAIEIVLWQLLMTSMHFMCNLIQQLSYRQKHVLDLMTRTMPCRLHREPPCVCAHLLSPSPDCHPACACQDLDWQPPQVGQWQKGLASVWPSNGKEEMIPAMHAPVADDDKTQSAEQANLAPNILVLLVVVPGSIEWSGKAWMDQAA